VKSDLFIAVKVGADVEIHAVGNSGSSYDTLCGMAVDDSDLIVERVILSTKSRSKITCHACISIIEHSWGYTRKDFYKFRG
jgi:hypothetical protein